MKRQDGVRETLKKYKPILRERFKVKEIGIFGSYVRGEESPESDVDILVEFSEPIGWEFLDIKELLEHILAKRVELVTLPMLRSSFKEKVLNEVVYI